MELKEAIELLKKLHDENADMIIEGGIAEDIVYDDKLIEELGEENEAIETVIGYLEGILVSKGQVMNNDIRRSQATG